MKVWVLLKWREAREGEHAGGDDASVHALCDSREALDRRIERIRRANLGYELRELSDRFWRIGPDEDEGFFGNRPVYLRAFEMEVTS